MHWTRFNDNIFKTDFRSWCLLFFQIELFSKNVLIIMQNAIASRFLKCDTWYFTCIVMNQNQNTIAVHIMCAVEYLKIINVVPINAAWWKKLIKEFFFCINQDMRLMNKLHEWFPKIVESSCFLLHYFGYSIHLSCDKHLP